MKSNNPKVYIALPVYNNKEQIEQTLNSLINQSYLNVEINIFDNCSTDGTSKICQSYSHTYDQVKYNRNRTNLKAAENFRNALFKGVSSSYDYFMYARGDGVLSKNLVREMVNLMESDCEASLVFPILEWVDCHGKKIENMKMGFYDTSGYNVATRISILLMTKPNQIYGMFRVKMLESLDTKKWWQIIGFDHVFLFELALKGHFRHLEKEKWFRLYKYFNEPFKKRMSRYRRVVLIKPDLLDKVIPLIKMPYYLMKTIYESKLSVSNKLKCVISVILISPLRLLISKNEKI